MTPAETQARVDAVRRFNHFYTRRIGVLNQAVFGTPFSLGEMRLLWELGHQDGASASTLHKSLGVDPAYVSRILRGFRERGWIEATPETYDARIRRLTLTSRGRKALVPLELASNQVVRAALTVLPVGQQDRLLDAMRAIETLLDEGRDPIGNYGLRDPQPGDFGWVVSHQGEVYAREYGWGAKLEGLIAEIVAKYIRDLKPARERCWIAERAGERVGSVFLVEHSATVAQLRLLLIDPSARGSGLGSRLIEECIRFARAADYRRIILWTHMNLTAARRLYLKHGFKLVKREPHNAFGHALTGETYSLALKAPGK